MGDLKEKNTSLSLKSISPGYLRNRINPIGLVCTGQRTCPLVTWQKSLFYSGFCPLEYCASQGEIYPHPPGLLEGPEDQAQSSGRGLQWGPLFWRRLMGKDPSSPCVHLTPFFAIFINFKVNFNVNIIMFYCVVFIWL